jgi:hypothetical protein
VDAEHLGARPLACRLRKRSFSPRTRWESHAQDHLRPAPPPSPAGSRTRYDGFVEEPARGVSWHFGGACSCCCRRRRCGSASLYRGDGLNRYAPVKGRPKTLADDFIDELLEVTGGGRARDFEKARDHAIIRILRSEGIRRSELLGMTMHTLPADVIRNPMFRLVPLKGARGSGEGRLIVLAPASARALAIYLRGRRAHPLADSDWVWLGTRGRGRFAKTGIRKMLIRRAGQAGSGQAAQKAT